VFERLYPSQLASNPLKNGDLIQMISKIQRGDLKKLGSFSQLSIGNAWKCALKKGLFYGVVDHSFFFDTLSRWWFQIFFIFTAKIGEDFQFDSYFSDGLKPPTS